MAGLAFGFVLDLCLVGRGIGVGPGCVLGFGWGCRSWCFVAAVVSGAGLAGALCALIWRVWGAVAERQMLSRFSALVLSMQNRFERGL